MEDIYKANVAGKGSRPHSKVLVIQMVLVRALGIKFGFLVVTAVYWTAQDISSASFERVTTRVTILKRLLHVFHSLV